ncbi:MAG TPA: LPS export ABC transporter periplasmic protein LptC, partial [Burkholderiaceae bacterium]
APPPLPPRGGGLRMRTRELLGTYLPLLLMLLLALGTWWLVKHTPRPVVSGDAAPLRQDPDYEMRDFAITRFAADGRATVRIEGSWLRHFPDTDRIEIESARLQSHAPDGRVTRAHAARALANGDGSEWQLSGGARVVAELPSGSPLEVDSEFLHVFVPTERIRSHLPVTVRQGSDEIRAGGIEANNLAQQLQLAPPVRASLSPRATQRFGAPRTAP